MRHLREERKQRREGTEKRRNNRRRVGCLPYATAKLIPPERIMAPMPSRTKIYMNWWPVIRVVGCSRPCSSVDSPLRRGDWGSASASLGPAASVSSDGGSLGREISFRIHDMAGVGTGEVVRAKEQPGEEAEANKRYRCISIQLPTSSYHAGVIWQKQRVAAWETSGGSVGSGAAG